jgi:transposase-like protein
VKVTRKRYSAEIKAQVAIDAIRGDRSVSDIADEHGVRPDQVIVWRKQLISNAVSLFQDRRLLPHQEKPHVRARSERLYREIGELAVELARGHLQSRRVRTYVCPSTEQGTAGANRSAMR